MAYTYDEVQSAIERQIDYPALASILQTDLNAIADQVAENAESTDYVTFEVFFDSGEFETKIEEPVAGEGGGFHNTPVLLKFVNGDYSTSRGPQFFSTVFSIEVFGFEKNREDLRTIFETYSSLNQGRIDNEEVGIYTTRTLEFPMFEAPILWKGSTRFQGFMRLFMTYMSDGQMSNQVSITLDEDEISVQSFNISRNRNSKSNQENEHQEVTTIYESQIITFSGAMLFDNSTAAVKLLNNLKTLDSGINTEYALAITYPVISETPDTYTVSLGSGNIAINEGGVITLNFVLTLAEV